MLRQRDHAVGTDLPMWHLVVGGVTAVDGQFPLTQLQACAMIKRDDKRLVKCRFVRSAQHDWTEQRLLF